jgi:hypothetical protein
MKKIGGKMAIAGRLLAGIGVLVIGVRAVQAQFVPGPGYYSDMGVFGSVTAAYTSAQQQQSYNENRQMQATSSMAKSQAWQNINRSMQAQAASRPSSVPDSGQAARDWMFQQSASSRPAGRPMTLPAASMASVDKVIKEREEQKEIMLWPTLLKADRFEGDRKDVEAPFRRAYADGKPLTVADYQGIIKTVDDMKNTVKSMESQLLDTEYDSVQKFLDDLIADAQKRIQTREAPAKSE